MKNDSLVKGGCGHSDKEITQSASNCTWCFLAVIAIVAVGLIF